MSGDTLHHELRWNVELSAVGKYTTKDFNKLMMPSRPYVST
jgi:hypothetical protein